MPAGATPSATPAVDPRVEEYKRDAAADIDSMSTFTQQMVDQVFSFGELGFQEVETSKYLTGILEKNGFTVAARRRRHSDRRGWRRGARASRSSRSAPTSTASRRRRRSRASRYHDPLVAGAPGHGEGHNSGVPLNITAAHRGEEDHGARALPGHAQALAGRRRGADGGEGVLRPRRHVQGRRRRAVRARRRRTSASRGARARQTALDHRAEFNFKGASAHAAGAPWRGRSALDAVELMDVGVEFPPRASAARRSARTT